MYQMENLFLKGNESAYKLSNLNCRKKLLKVKMMYIEKEGFWLQI